MSESHSPEPAESSEFSPEYHRPPRPQGIGSLRKGSSTFEICNGPIVISIESRVGLDLPTLLAAEAADYRAGLIAAIAEDDDPADYARGDEDRAVWCGGRLVALLRATLDGSLELTELGPDRPLDRRILVHVAELLAAEEDDLAAFVTETEARP